MNSLVRTRGGVDEERGASSLRCGCLQGRTRSSYLELEGRIRRRAEDRACLGVEQDGGLVARSVLELLHHQMPTFGSRGPMHAAQRLTLLVVAHGVEIEPGRPPQE